jgi:hypothetical protein
MQNGRSNTIGTVKMKKFATLERVALTLCVAMACYSLQCISKPVCSTITSKSSPYTLRRPNATNLCFVTSVFAENVTLADRPSNVLDWLEAYPDKVKFYMYTNIPELATEGWTSVYKNFSYRRYITQSRWGKFLAWQDELIQENCHAVFYVDGYIRPNVAQASTFFDVANKVRESKDGLAQFKHKRAKKGISYEFLRILMKQKDGSDNVMKTIIWLEKQKDFSWDCTLYLNTYIAYNPQNERFHKAVLTLWDHYSLEQDSWRDQPLWCYVLDKLHMQPIVLPPALENQLYTLENDRRGYNDHRYIGNGTEAVQAR